MKKLVALIIAVLAIVIVASSAMAVEYEMQRHFVFFNLNEHFVPEKIVYDKLSGIPENAEISVFGYADQRGSVEWNRQLAQLRADFLASVIKKQLPGINFREVTGIINKDTADATTGEIRIFTPKESLAAFGNAIDGSGKKVLTGLEELEKNLNESDQKVLTGLERVEDALKKSDKGNGIALVSAIALFPVFFLIALLFFFRKRLFGKTESVKEQNQYWPKELNLVAYMYLKKKNGDQSRGCPFCNADVRGKNYVAHLRRCATSPLHDKTAEEAKEILKANQ